MFAFILRIVRAIVVMLVISQYRVFGVLCLGLKRGLGEKLVQYWAKDKGGTIIPLF